MNRVTGQLAILLAIGLFAIRGAEASDIVCKTTPRARAARADKRPHAARLICDYALLSLNYERIYADQQRLLRAGAIRQADILAWRRKRDACDSVHCLDGVFAQWPPHEARRQPARDARRASKHPEKLERLAAHDSPRRGEAARPMPLKEGEGKPQAPMQPVAPQRDAQPAMHAAATDTALGAAPALAKAVPLADKKASGPRVALGNVAWLGAFGLSLAYLLKRARDGRLRRLYALYRTAPAPMLVLYGLIAVNVLLLLVALVAG